MKILDYKSADFWRELNSACKPDSENPQIASAVDSVISKVRESGDSALEELTLKFDGVKIPAADLRVKPDEIKKALSLVSPADKKAIREAVACVKAFISPGARRRSYRRL